MKTPVGCVSQRTDNMKIENKFLWHIKMEGAVATAPYANIIYAAPHKKGGGYVHDDEIGRDFLFKHISVELGLL